MEAASPVQGRACTQLPLLLQVNLGWPLGLAAKACFSALANVSKLPEVLLASLSPKMGVSCQTSLETPGMGYQDSFLSPKELSWVGDVEPLNAETQLLP